MNGTSNISKAQVGSRTIYALSAFFLLVAVSSAHGQSPPYANATSSHTEEQYQWNVGIRGVTTFPGTAYTHNPSAGRLQSATVIQTSLVGMYGLEVKDTIDIPFFVATSSSSHRIDFSYKVTGLLHTLKASAYGEAKGFYDIWVDASIVDLNGNSVPGQIGTWDQLYRSDVSWATFAGEAASIAIAGAIDAYGPGWASAVLEIIDTLDNLIPEHVFNTTYSRFIRAPLSAGQWYTLRIQLGSKTGSAALGLGWCLALTDLDLQVLSITTPGAPAAPSSINYPPNSASGSYSVSWPASAGATSYRVERSSNGGSTWEYAYSGVDRSFAESRSNGSYRYRVRASNSAGNSDWKMGTHDCVVNIQAAGSKVTVKYDTVADAHVASYDPNRNYGDAITVNVYRYNEERTIGLIRFGSMNLPTSTTIDSASLKMYAYNGRTTTPSIAARLVAESWTENGVNWNNAPWFISPPEPILATFPSLTQYYAWISIDVTSFVREWVSRPQSNLGIGLIPNSTDMMLGIRSKDHPTSSQRPYLEVTFFESIGAPTSVSGPNAGQTGESLNFTASGASSSLGHSVRYQFDWGDGTESSWGSASRSKTYNTPGTYGIKVRARCQDHTEARSEWSEMLRTVVITQAHTVNTPNTPSGSSTGFVGTSYEFSTSGSSCSHGHGVEYQFDWGDGNQSGWGGPSAFKSYESPNNYNVRARARCSVNTSIVSGWSGTKLVTISPVPTHRLDVASSGASAVVMGSTTSHGGTTPYHHTITQGTAIHLNAPEYVGTGANRKRFTEWTGVVNTTAREISFDMDSAKSLTANYEDAPFNNPPDRPTLLSPANGVTGVSLTPMLEASAFSDPDPGDTHSGSRWMVFNAGGTEIVWDSGIDPAATSIQIPVSTLEYSTEYVWGVWYYDSQGETYGGMTPSSFTTMADPASDTTPPTVTITSPTSGATWTSPNATMNIVGTAWDNVEVTLVTVVNVRDGIVRNASGTTSWQYNNLPLFQGQNQITVTARDAAGNSATDRITVTYGLSPVHRFWSHRFGSHFYIMGDSERDRIAAKYLGIWHYEAVAWYAYPTQVAGTEPVHRFWSDRLGKHFFIMGDSERDRIAAKYVGIWRYEAVAWYAHPTQVSGAEPVGRFWSDQFMGHFYTITQSEINRIAAKYPGIWNYETVAYWAFPTLDARSRTWEEQPSDADADRILSLAAKSMVFGRPEAYPGLFSVSYPLGDEGSRLYVFDPLGSGWQEVNAGVDGWVVLDDILPGEVQTFEVQKWDASPVDRGSVVWQTDAPTLNPVDSAGAAGPASLNEPKLRVKLPETEATLTVRLYSSRMGVVETVASAPGGGIVELAIPEWNGWYWIGAWRESDNALVLSIWMRQNVE